jgi:hypothetical protein
MRLRWIGCGPNCLRTRRQIKNRITGIRISGKPM